MWKDRGDFVASGLAPDGRVVVRVKCCINSIGKLESDRESLKHKAGKETC